MRALVATLAVGVAISAVPPAQASDNPVERARRAVEHSTFTGLVRMRWTDDHGTHEQLLTVQASDGVLVVRGAQAAMARQEERLIGHEDQAWELLWPARLSPHALPELGPKYQASVGSGPTVAGHATVLVEVVRDGGVRERLFVEPDSGLLLGREQYDADGHEVRAVVFEQLSLGATSPAPTGPTHPADHGARAVEPATLRAGFRAPAELADGWRRLGVYRRGGVVHVLYADGAYELSVFEERGRLDRGALPPGARSVRVGDSPGWTFSWPGGQVVMWQAGRSVYTAVGDASADEIVRAARSVPVTSVKPSLGQRLRGACRAVLEAFSP